MKIVIIGNSAAGIAAVEAIRGCDRKSSIIQLSDEARPVYSRCLLSNYLAGTVDDKGLLYREQDFHQKMDVELHAGPDSRVVALDTVKKQVTCKDGRTFNFDKLLLATGSSAKLPGDIPSNLDNIFVLRNLADAEVIAQKMKQAKSAVVLGGGLIGIKAATALNRAGLKTTVVIRSDRVLSQMIDGTASQIVTGALRDAKIDVLFNTGIKFFSSRDHRLIGIETDGKKYIDCDLLVVAKGVKPNVDLLRSTDIKTDWGIRTNSTMQTTCPDVYAAGDVAEAYDITLENHTVNALWICAVQQGRVAGLNMIGKKVEYDGAVGMNSFNVCDISLVSFGMTSPPADVADYRILALERPEKKIYKKIVLDSRHRIKGIILVGHIANAGVLLSLIRSKRDVSAFADELLDDAFNFGALLKYGGQSQLDKYYTGKDF